MIHYLASKFTQELFKRMQIKFYVSRARPSITGLDDYNLDEFKTILPKHIDIKTYYNLKLDDLRDVLELFD
jgi:hypothetical protein